MGCVLKLIDAVLFLYFLSLAIVVPLFDAQTVLPQEHFPKILVDLVSWYGNEYGDYLCIEKPHFFVGLAWLELLLLWPLSIASLVAKVSGKSWFNTTCLIAGVNSFTSMAAIMAELIYSGRASEKLLMVYAPFMGMAALAILRGLICCSSKSSATGKKPAPGLARKKRA